MFDTIWNLLQSNQISENERKTKNIASASRSNAISVREAHRRLESLAVTNQAMWELLVEKLGVTDEQLLTKIREIESRPAKSAGDSVSEKQPEVNCIECGKKIGKRVTKCYWCGARIAKSNPFDV